MSKKSSDNVLLAIVIILNLFGLLMISSASVVMSYNNFESNYYYATHQFFYGLLPGIALMLVFRNINYEIYKKYALLFLIATILLLFIVFVPGIGFGVKGASRWIVFGDFSFQPSEIAKLTFILYFASWLYGKEKEIKDFSKGLLSFITVIAIMSVPLLLQPDFSTLIILAIIASSMYFASGAKISHIFLLGAISVFAILALVKVAPYRMDRLTVFLHPEIDPQGIGYQINQALLAIGSGGIFGLGFGHSRQKYNYLPEPMGDSIFAIIGEELGFIGLAILVILFFFLAYRGYKIASVSRDKFGKLVAVGITSWIIFQAIINISAITSLMPLTGVPLPFISYGGSSLLACLLAIGILLNISKNAGRSAG